MENRFVSLLHDLLPDSSVVQLILKAAEEEVLLYYLKGSQDMAFHVASELLRQSSLDMQKISEVTGLSLVEVCALYREVSG